jgi:flagellar secretion chaperone FliS
MRHFAYDSYQEAEILSADPLELVRLLYRGAIEAIGEARQCLAAREIAGRARAINKALRIVTELAFSLDHRNGAGLSRTLVELYDYVQRLLIDANCRQVDPPLAEAGELMATLLEAWERCDAGSRAPGHKDEECEYAPVSCAG